MIKFFVIFAMQQLSFCSLSEKINNTFKVLDKGLLGQVQSLRHEMRCLQSLQRYSQPRTYSVLISKFWIGYRSEELVLNDKKSFGKMEGKQQSRKVSKLFPLIPQHQPLGKLTHGRTTNIFVLQLQFNLLPRHLLAIECYITI